MKKRRKRRKNNNQRRPPLNKMNNPNLVFINSIFNHISQSIKESSIKEGIKEEGVRRT
jgi:hypothetical protein